MRPEPALALHDLSKQFPGGRGLRSVRLTVEPGEIFGFLGPNGAGKTTTIRTLMGFLRPSGGRATIFGRDVWRERPAAHARVGYLPGEVKLPAELTPAQLLRRAATLRGLRDPRASYEVAERLGLDLSRRAGTLSKGNRQKIGLTLALLGHPDLLILDEPTDGLDPLVQEEVLTLLREAREQGRSVFLSSHVLSEVERVADRVGLIRAGRLVRVEPLKQLRASFPLQLHARFDHGVPAALLALPGLGSADVQGGELRAQWTGEPAPLLAALHLSPPRALTLTPTTLEDAFLGAYQEDPHA